MTSSTNPIPVVSTYFLSSFLVKILNLNKLNFAETLFLDYRHFDQANISPDYEFGFGLSYTKFSYSQLKVSRTSSGATVSFTLENVGTRDGVEIPQLYIGFPAGAGEPPKLLRGFDDIQLGQNESQQVTFTLSQRDLR